jgi:type I restriction-modification system DNA methylase subunit
MKNRIGKIEGLSRAEAIEAAQYYCLSINVDKFIGKYDKSTLNLITEKPQEYIEEIDELARIILIHAALNPEYGELVDRAIAGAGRKQIVLGGVELITISVLLIIAVQIIITRGKKEEEEDIRIEEKDGKFTIHIKKKTSYGIGAKLASILKGLITSS